MNNIKKLVVVSSENHPTVKGNTTFITLDIIDVLNTLDSDILDKYCIVNDVIFTGTATPDLYKHMVIMPECSITFFNTYITIHIQYNQDFSVEIPIYKEFLQELLNTKWTTIYEYCIGDIPYVIPYIRFADTVLLFGVYGIKACNKLKMLTTIEHINNNSSDEFLRKFIQSIVHNYDGIEDFLISRKKELVKLRLLNNSDLKIKEQEYQFLLNVLSNKTN